MDNTIQIISHMGGKSTVHFSSNAIININDAFAVELNIATIAIGIKNHIIDDLKTLDIESNTFTDIEYSISFVFYGHKPIIFKLDKTNCELFNVPCHALSLHCSKAKNDQMSYVEKYFILNWFDIFRLLHTQFFNHVFDMVLGKHNKIYAGYSINLESIVQFNDQICTFDDVLTIKGDNVTNDISELILKINKTYQRNLNCIPELISKYKHHGNNVFDISFAVKNDVRRDPKNDVVIKYDPYTRHSDYFDSKILPLTTICDGIRDHLIMRHNTKFFSYGNICSIIKKIILVRLDLNQKNRPNGIVATETSVNVINEVVNTKAEHKELKPPAKGKQKKIKKVKKVKKVKKDGN